MKKILLVISMMFALTACVFEKMPQAVSVDNEGDVVINFSIVVPEAQAMTKTLDTPAIDSLTVAVFDENGFFVTARQAKRTDAWGVGSEPTEFKVKLPQSTTPLNLHFVANKLTTDFNYGMETDVMTSLVTTKRKDAYWQVVSVNSILQADIESGALSASLTNIPMVRNYAKIVVVNGDEQNFTLSGFRVLNAPTSGTVVPYNVNSEDFQLYWKASGDKKVGHNYTELNGELYHGFMPAGFNENTDVSDLPANDGWTIDPVYTYERIYDESAQKPLSILIEGVFKDSDENTSYYKVDLYDAENLNYDVLRNIEYTVTITEVLGDGYDSADEAASNTAGNNISFSNTTNSLLNISDGNCRLFVEYVTKRVVSEDVFYLKYKFAPDITDDLTNPASYKNAIVNSYNTTGTPTNTNPLTITCNNPEGSEGSVISGWEYDQDYGTDSEGWSRIKLTPKSDYTSGNWMEDLVITSTYDVDPSDVTQNVVLSRTVKLYRLNPYELNVVCTENVAKTVGAPLTVYTEIPTDLPEDIFPLVFSIEAEALSIYPQPGRVNDLREVITMPVVSGNTIIEGNTKPSFHFDRTLTWEEYEELKKKVTNNDGVRVPSYFLTNIAESATTVHVYNEYFESRSDDFKNFDDAKFFTNLSFPDGVKLASDSETTFTFSMTTTDDVNVTLLGLKNAAGSSTFVYKPTSVGTQELTLKTIDAEGIVSVILEAEEAGYVPATLSYERAFKMSATLEGEQYYGENKTVTLNLTTNKPGSYTVIFTEGEGENAKSEQTTIIVTEDQTEAVATYTTQTFSGAISATVISDDTQISVPGDTRNVLVLGKMTGGSNAPGNYTYVTIYNARTDDDIQRTSWSNLAAGGVEVAIDGLTDQNITAVYFEYSSRSGRNTYYYKTDPLNGNQAMSDATLNFNQQ